MRYLPRIKLEEEINVCEQSDNKFKSAETHDGKSRIGANESIWNDVLNFSIRLTLDPLVDFNSGAFSIVDEI